MWTRGELKTAAKASLKTNYWKCLLTALILTLVSGGSSAVSTSRSTQNEEVRSTLGSMSVETMVSVVAVVGSILAIGGIIGLLLKILVFNPLAVGCQRFFVLNGREPASLREIIFVFNSAYGNVVKIMFFRDLFTILWTLLLIIPGIVKSYEYRMIPYLLAENPDMDSNEVFATTKQMMAGDKLNAFVLDWSFILWHILGIITFGIVEVFYVAPYTYLTNAQLYETLKAKI